MTVVGRYELVGVYGGPLPASLDLDVAWPEAGGGVVAGELRLEGDGTYVLEVTARHGAATGAVRTISCGGTWRFLPSALDRTSGEVRLTSARGQTSAAVAGVSLVHLVEGSAGGSGPRVHWVYIRR